MGLGFLARGVISRSIEKITDRAENWGEDRECFRMKSEALHST
jgi:hypothetical protein